MRASGFFFLFSAGLLFCSLTIGWIASGSSLSRFYDVQTAETYLKIHGSCIFCDLQTSELQNQDLTGADLRYANLIGTDFSSSALAKTNFTGATLRRADLSSVTTLKDANFTDANLTEANIRPEKLAEAYLCRTHMPDGSFHATCEVPPLEPNADLTMGAL